MKVMRSIVLVFIDGLGLGDPESPTNPCVHPALDILANFRPGEWTPPRDGGRPESLPVLWRRGPMPFGGVARVTDASLGVLGLPQSATGQTTIFTGLNAALVLGRHLYAYPTVTLQRILMEHSILKRVVDAGLPAVFANAFRPIFFELGDAVWKRSMSASSWANRAAGLPFMTIEDLKERRAVYQDITHDSLRARFTPRGRSAVPVRGVDLPLREPEEAGTILASIASEHAFTLFEFFQTDKAGHAQDRDKAERELLKLERFLLAVLEDLDLTTSTLVVTSDHGNVEDLSTKSHTHNPVPTLVFGQDAPLVADRLDRLEHFTPAILDALGLQ
jgi:2,3-bisphosphoglycerate-independent phosphoglycerate mutase